jgi:hypothetical protein
VFDKQLVLWTLPKDWLEKAIEVIETRPAPMKTMVGNFMSVLYGLAAPRAPEIPSPEAIKATIDAKVQEKYLRIFGSAKADMHYFFREYQAERDLVLPGLRRAMGELGDKKVEGPAAENPKEFSRDAQ